MKQVRLHDDVHGLLLSSQAQYPPGTSLTTIANQKLREGLLRKTVTTTATAVKIEVKTPPAPAGDNERQI